MRISSTRPTHPSRTLGRRVLAASAGLGLALSLTACTIGETNIDDDKTAAAATTSESSAVQQSDATTSAPAPEDAEKKAEKTGTPDVPVDQLIINAQDAPELGLTPISADEISGGMDALSGFADGMTFNPPECADFNQDAVLAQSAPGVLAIQSGQIDQSPISVGVSTDIGSIQDRTAQVEDCPTVTITMPLQGTEVTAEMTNALIGFEAPEGVEQYAALAQETKVDMMGTPIQSGNIAITGTVRGVGVSVTATNANGPVPDAVRDAAQAAFVKQVEKIRAA